MNHSFDDIVHLINEFQNADLPFETQKEFQELQKQLLFYETIHDHLLISKRSILENYKKLLEHISEKSTQGHENQLLDNALDYLKSQSIICSLNHYYDNSSNYDYISSANVDQNELTYMAYFDCLTGLVNRQYFMQHLESLIHKKIKKPSFIVGFIDLDGFKEINDIHGHDKGDWLLTQVGKRLKSIFRNKDIVSRFGGDEFTFIMHDTRNILNFHFIAERIIKEITAPYIQNDAIIHIGLSIGFTRYPENGKTADELLKQADSSMYFVKRTGKNGYKGYTKSA